MNSTKKKTYSLKFKDNDDSQFESNQCTNDFAEHGAIADGTRLTKQLMPMQFTEPQAFYINQRDKKKFYC